MPDWKKIRARYFRQPASVLAREFSSWELRKQSTSPLHDFHLSLCQSIVALFSFFNRPTSTLVLTVFPVSFAVYACEMRIRASAVPKKCRQDQRSSGRHFVINFPRYFYTNWNRGRWWSQTSFPFRISFHQKPDCIFIRLPFAGMFEWPNWIFCNEHSRCFDMNYSGPDDSFFITWYKSLSRKLVQYSRVYFWKWKCQDPRIDLYSNPMWELKHNSARIARTAQKKSSWN